MIQKLVKSHFLQHLLKKTNCILFCTIFRFEMCKVINNGFYNLVKTVTIPIQGVQNPFSSEIQTFYCWYSNGTSHVMCPMVQNLDKMSDFKWSTKFRLKSGIWTLFSPVFESDLKFGPFQYSTYKSYIQMICLICSCVKTYFIELTLKPGWRRSHQGSLPSAHEQRNGPLRLRLLGRRAPHLLRMDRVRGLRRQVRL